MLNLQGSFENLRSSSLIRSSNKFITPGENHLPFNFSIRIPKQLYRKIDELYKEDV